MAEEKKDVKKEVQKPAEPAAAKPVEQKPAEPAAPVVEAKADAKGQVAAEPAKAAEPKKAEAPKEKPANCASCNKSIKTKRWYYRNEKYYCSKIRYSCR